MSARVDRDGAGAAGVARLTLSDPGHAEYRQGRAAFDQKRPPRY